MCAALFDDTAVVALIRSFLGEASAKFWTDVDITSFKNAAMININSEYGYMLYPLMKKTATDDMTATTATIAYPTDCYRVGKVEVYENNTGTWQSLRYVQEDEIFRFSSMEPGDPIAWTHADGAVTIFPTPNSTSTDYFRLWYSEYLNSVADFPEEARPLIAVEAAMLGRMKDGGIPRDWYELRDRYAWSLVVALANVQFQEPDIVRDFEAEEGYTSNVEQ